MAPITDPSLPPCALNAASERTTACRQPLRNANGRRLLPTSCSPLKQIARVSREGARGESTKRCGQRAGLPQSTLRAPTVAAAPSSNLQLLALKSLQPWPQLWPDARSKLLQPSAPRRPLRASQAEQLRARRPPAKPKRARPPQSSAAKLWAQASAAATFSTRSSGSARLALAINSLQPSPELSSGHSQPSTPCRPAQASSQAPASPYEAV